MYILLRDLISEERDVEKRSVWQTYTRKFGARNSLGQVRYFDDRETATKFARGEIEGPRIGRPEPKKRPKPKQKKQKYDTKPAVPYDAEEIS